MKAQSLFGLSAVLGAAALAVGCTADVGKGPNGASSGAGPGGGTTSGTGGTSVVGAGGSANGVCGPTTTTRIWRLSDEEYKNVVTDLLPGANVPEVTTPGRAAGEFINMAERLPVTGAYASSLRTSVKAVASAAVKDLPNLLKCAAGVAAVSGRRSFMRTLI